MKIEICKKCPCFFYNEKYCYCINQKVELEKTIDKKYIFFSNIKQPLLSQSKRAYTKKDFENNKFVEDLFSSPCSFKLEQVIESEN